MPEEKRKIIMKSANSLKNGFYRLHGEKPTQFLIPLRKVHALDHNQRNNERLIRSRGRKDAPNRPRMRVWQSRNKLDRFNDIRVIHMIDDLYCSEADNLAALWREKVITHKQHEHCRVMIEFSCRVRYAMRKFKEFELKYGDSYYQYGVQLINSLNNDEFNLLLFSIRKPSLRVVNGKQDVLGIDNLSTAENLKRYFLLESMERQRIDKDIIDIVRNDIFISRLLVYPSHERNVKVGREKRMQTLREKANDLDLSLLANTNDQREINKARCRIRKRAQRLRDKEKDIRRFFI